MLNSIVSGALCALVLCPLGEQSQQRRRIAVSADGNYHDQDDWGASAMQLALIWKEGVQSELVHFEYNNHLCSSSSSWEAEMRTSVFGNLEGFRVPRHVFFDVQLEPDGAAMNLAREIEASSHLDELVIAACGPWETIVSAFDLADPTRHQYVTIITHSYWNDKHEASDDHGGCGKHRDRFEFEDYYESGGKWSKQVGPTIVDIPDGNDHAFYQYHQSHWAWMKAERNLEFVYNRTGESSQDGDMSDACMLFWLFTGIDKASMSDIRDFFEL